MSLRQVIVILVCFLIAVPLDWGLVQWHRKYKARKKMEASQSDSRKLSWYERSIARNALELLPLTLLSLFMAAPYLMNFQTDYFPNGYEFDLVTVTHFIWNYLLECGSCVFWNGVLNGGMPAFAEVHGAVLHPLVIATTVLWGVINGSKVIILVSLIMSGVATWWFAKELDVRRLARIWISLFGVVGGHLIGRMEAGNVIFMFSIASASLLFPMVLRLNKKPTNKRVASLALLMALTWLSGQGYIQLAVVLAWFPAFWFLLYEKGQKRQEKWIAFGKAFLISILLCGIFFLPTARSMVHGMDKPSCDDFHDVQPMRYLPLNLVIGDAALMGETYLGMDTFPYAHINFIDWTPVILAVIAGHFVLRQPDKKIYAAIYLSILLAMIFTSREIYVFLYAYFPVLAKICSMGGSSSLIVPPLLAMAAWGLDRVLELDWFVITKNKGSSEEAAKSVSLKWFILIPILILSFKNVIPFSKNYLGVHKVELPEQEVAFARTSDAQWINTPFSGDWVLTFLNEGIKIIMWERHWSWNDRTRLVGYIGFTDNPDDDVQILSKQPDFYVTVRPSELYATVNTGAETVKCEAVSRGGNIDVTCDAPAPGTLTVLEYQYGGWRAWVDGHPVPFIDGEWLSVEAPAGRHTFSFRYRPWDVYAGMTVSLAGIGILLWLWIKKEKPDETG